MALFLVGFLPSNDALISFPFYIAGGVKLVYDVPLYSSFKHHEPDANS
jgi:hypothetical protein